MKAFLSHSSTDKEFVRAIANELGRQYCVFDEQSFDSGEDFKTSIENGLDESSVFVLFATRQSLKSLWVEFETKEAWYGQLRHKLPKSLVYIIDSSVQIEDIPEWLRRTLIRREKTPKVVARDIKFHLEEILRERQNPFFVGRSSEVEEIEQTLTPLDTLSPPHAVFITGLPGIGRRSLIKRVAPSILNLRKFVELRIGEGDSINDICLIVADHIEPYSTKEGLERIVAEIRVLTDEEALNRILENLRLMITAGELPIFFDQGGLLDNDGYMQAPIRTLLRQIQPNDTAYIFFVSPRRPQRSSELTIPVVSIRPLRENESRRLLTMLAGQSLLEVSPAQINDLAAYVAGYPPSAYFAIQQAKYYGMDLLIREKAQLVQFRTSVFLKHLAKQGLSDNEQEILRLLAVYSPLPIQVIAQTFDVSIEVLSGLLIKLIDLAFVATTEDGLYRVADPISEAATKAFGFPSESKQRAIANNLNEFLQNAEVTNTRLELSRVLFRAASLVNDRELANTTIHLAADIIKITETLYHERNYEEAARYGYTALEQRPDNLTARNYLIRSLIQLERWDEAESQIENLNKYAGQRDVYYLKGFLERKRGRTERAIEAYKEAEKLGRRGVALSRELALCYFVINDQVSASRYIEEAIAGHGDNRYVVDLWVQIATRKGDEQAARQGLGRLEVLDNPLYYLHRLSRVELAFRYAKEARDASIRAVEIADRPPFEVLAQLLYCEIELGNIEAAEKVLQTLDQKFGNIKHDVRLGLRCRLEIAKGRFGEAIAQSERTREKSSPFYKKIRYDALVGEVKHSALGDATRASYEAEIAKLGEQLSNLNIGDSVLLEVD